jgi:uncharacterized protein YbgA (DUF1722 family)/uncharacterized protein YbbK (DUF523 family)
MSESRPRIGVSRCLLGDKVRYDGGHKADHFLIDVLAAHVDWVPVCPEVEAGMGLPRESVHLAAASDGVPAGSEQVRMVGVRSGRDWTEALTGAAAARVRDLAAHDLSGFILKKDSPSCGLMRVRVHHPKKAVTRTGRGLFAEALVGSFPSMPVEEEGRLHDVRLRENFIEAVFAYARVKALFSRRWSIGALVDFHTRHKLQLLSHSRVKYAELGRLVARAKTLPRTEVAAQYLSTFMSALSIVVSRGRHVDVMQHMLGHFKTLLRSDDRQEILDLMADYRAGIVPLIVPVTLFRHHVRTHDVGYLQGQTYLEPHPRELALRNHA